MAAKKNVNKEKIDLLKRRNEVASWRMTNSIQILEKKANSAELLGLTGVSSTLYEAASLLRQEINSLQFDLQDIEFLIKNVVA